MAKVIRDAYCLSCERVWYAYCSSCERKFKSIRRSRCVTQFRSVSDYRVLVKAQTSVASPRAVSCGAAESFAGSRKRWYKSWAAHKSWAGGDRPSEEAAAVRSPPPAVGRRRPPMNSETGHVDRPGRCPRARICLKLGMHICTCCTCTCACACACACTTSVK